MLGEVSDRLRCRHIVHAVPTAPVLRLPPDKGADGTQIALMAQEVCLLLALGPEADSVGESVHGLPVPTDEGATKVDMLHLVLLRLEVCNLANVVTGDS